MPLQTCVHIFPDHHRCGSPALRGETHCFYHHPTRKPAQSRRARGGFQLNRPDTPITRQQALGTIIQRLAANKLDVHRAGLLLYALQIAEATPGPAPS